ncbi:hypothetical protein MP228_004837 [Amoeboaphelidium protococcarum]|nr:hypothetical protein MP228_004837 [Amoeboaphelidium protococcarum]
MKVAVRWILALNAVLTWFSPFNYAESIAIITMLNLLLLGTWQKQLVITYIKFAWNCFFKPFFTSKSSSSNAEATTTTTKDSNAHQQMLEKFYEGQADIYDQTRARLLAGRSTMLRLCAAQLKQVYLKDLDHPIDRTQTAAASAEDCGSDADHCSEYIPSPMSSPYLRPVPVHTGEKKLIWIDIGGGTGSNVEIMNNYIPIDHFHAVYVVDITPSLCRVAEQRFQRLGWSNVHVKCMDALAFDVDMDADDVEIGLITMSYSLSMFPSHYAIVDKVYDMLSPCGLVGVSDFYVSSKHPTPHDPSRHHGWLTRKFWQSWFELDNIYLSPERREYLEHKFATIKVYNGRNWVIKGMLGMPYYVFIGTHSIDYQQVSTESKSAVDLNQAVQKLNNYSTLNDWNLDDDNDDQGVDSAISMSNSIASKAVGNVHAVSKRQGKPLLSFKHVHGQSHQWRMEFDPTPIPGLSTYIYAFAWEDPKVDLQFLDLQKDDQMLILTSGGCNALEYALHGPHKIHCVDMNPCQGHLLELKIAAMTALTYEDVWSLFGEGYHPSFELMLDTRLSPYLSLHAYQFWKSNCAFTNFYHTGSSGLAIRAFKFLAKVKRLDRVIVRLCTADNLQNQIAIWENELRHHFLDRKWIGLLNSYKFAWEALGVPKEQLEMLLSDGDVYDYIVNTFDPLVRAELLSETSYFYHLCLSQRYANNNSGNCPEWLTQKGYDRLIKTANLRSIRIHTRPIAAVLNDLADGSLTKCVVMDHMDWFDEKLAQEEVEAFQRKMKAGGRILIRSAAKKPWYLRVFEEHQFRVSPLGVRVSDKEKSSGKWDALLAEISSNHQDALLHECIDRVNMYASFWVAVKQ